MAYIPLQPPLEQSQTPSSGDTKTIIIQETRPQNVMMPPVHYAQDPYHNNPQFEPYPASTAYAIPPDGTAFPQQQCQSYTDLGSYLHGSPNAPPYNALGTPGQFGGSSFQQGP